MYLTLALLLSGVDVVVVDVVAFLCTLLRHGTNLGGSSSRLDAPPFRLLPLWVKPDSKGSRVRNTFKDPGDPRVVSTDNERRTARWTSRGSGPKG